MRLERRGRKRKEKRKDTVQMETPTNIKVISHRAGAYYAMLPIRGKPIPVILKVCVRAQGKFSAERHSKTKTHTKQQQQPLTDTF